MSHKLDDLISLPVLSEKLHCDCQLNREGSCFNYLDSVRVRSLALLPPPLGLQPLSLELEYRDESDEGPKL